MSRNGTVRVALALYPVVLVVALEHHGGASRPMTKRRWLLHAESMRCPRISRAHQPPSRGGSDVRVSSTCPNEIEAVTDGGVEIGGRWLLVS